MAYIMRELGDVPALYLGEATQYISMVFTSKSTIGAYTFTSSSSGVTYSGASGGQQQLFDDLSVALSDYQITAVDWNVIRSWIYGQGNPVEDGYRNVLSYTGNLLTDVSLYKSDLTTLVSKKTLTYSSVSGLLESVRLRIYDVNGSTILMDYIDNLIYKNTNVIGTIGNCEDYTLWTALQATLSNDSSNKVEGSNSLKVTATTNPGSGYKNILQYLNPSSYYFISGFIKHISGTNSAFRFNTLGTGATVKTSSLVTNTSNFENVGLIVSPTDWGTGYSVANLYCTVFGVATSAAYFDAIKVFEISSADASLTIPELLTKYPNDITTLSDGNLLHVSREVTI